MLWFCTKWIAGTLAGFVGGFVTLFVLVGVATGPDGPEGAAFVVLFSLVLGGAVALMATLQWRTMRPRAPHTARWIPHTVLAVIAASVLVFGGLDHGDSWISSLVWGLLHATIAGAIVGVAQWWVIRGVDPQWHWIRATVLAWLAAELVGDTVAWHTDGGIGMLVIFVLWTALTAPTLYRLTARVAPANGAVSTTTWS